jgi:phosphoadenosine phosphosulfate reductase
MRARQDSPYDLAPAPELPLDRRAARLLSRYGRLQGADLLRPLLRDEFPGRAAMTSSFGAEAAVLLHMVAEIAPATPVLFLDTGKLFDETLAYRDALIDRLGLSDVRTLTPAAYELNALDPKGDLHATAPDQCCFVRKVAPLDRGIAGFDAWITGRKAYQSAGRSGLKPIEAAEGRIKINPLLGWRPADIDAYMARHGLPAHPLLADGFLSIGCAPCTDRACAGEDPRAGRWRGRGKTECGIHLPGRTAATLSGGEGEGS